MTQHFRLVRYDRRGHGKSSVPKGPYTMERLGRDVLGVLDGLGIRKINWCGLSMGGMVGMWLGANAANRIDKLILSNTSAHFPDKSIWDGRIKMVREKGLAGIVDANMERWFTKGFRERAPQAMAKMREMFLATKIDGYIGCGEAIRDMDHRPLLPKITAPTLVIAGRHDPATTLEAGEFIKAAHPRRPASPCSTRRTSPTSSSRRFTPTRCSDFCWASHRRRFGRTAAAGTLHLNGDVADETVGTPVEIVVPLSCAIIRSMIRVPKPCASAPYVGLRPRSSAASMVHPPDASNSAPTSPFATDNARTWRRLRQFVQGRCDRLGGLGLQQNQRTAERHPSFGPFGIRCKLTRCDQRQLGAGPSNSTNSEFTFAKACMRPQWRVSRP